MDGNRGLEEVGKALLGFANLFAVLFAVNFLFQPGNFSLRFLALIVYIFLSLYIASYALINRAHKKKEKNHGSSV